MSTPADDVAQPAWDHQRALQWRSFAPPARPSSGEVAVYDRSLPRDTRRFAILGATPELRSLARRRGIEAVCIDVNREIFTALAALTTEPGREELLDVNWLDLVAADPLDAVAGDGSINMLPRHRHARFLERVAGALRPGGRALLRVHIVGPRVYPDERAVVEAYRRQDDPGSFWTWTRTHFDMLWRDDDDAVHFGSYHQRIQALFDAGMLRPEEHVAYQSVAAVNAITLYYAKRDVFEAQVSIHFDIDCARSAGDYERSDLHPVYVLTKKS